MVWRFPPFVSSLQEAWKRRKEGDDKRRAVNTTKEGKRDVDGEIKKTKTKDKFDSENASSCRLFLCLPRSLFVCFFSHSFLPSRLALSSVSFQAHWKNSTCSLPISTFLLISRSLCLLFNLSSSLLTSVLP